MEHGKVERASVDEFFQIRTIRAVGIEAITEEIAESHDVDATTSPAVWILTDVHVVIRKEDELVTRMCP